jgi:hypothetical protein
MDGNKATGIKHDQGKPEMALVDAYFIEQLAAVLTFGARKYSSENWRGGLSTKRTLSAVLRHVFSFLKGEDNDPESGLPHLAHAACGLMFTIWMTKHKPELDDRYKDGK